MVTNMGETVQTRGMLYNAFVQLVLVYGSNIWVVMGAVLKVLGGFHHRVAIIITGITAQCTTSREWEWPPVVEVLDTSGIYPIKEYI